MRERFRTQLVLAVFFPALPCKVNSIVSRQVFLISPRVSSLCPDSKEAYIRGPRGQRQRKGDYPQSTLSAGVYLLIELLKQNRHVD